VPCKEPSKPPFCSIRHIDVATPRRQRQRSYKTVAVSVAKTALYPHTLAGNATASIRQAFEVADWCLMWIVEGHVSPLRSHGPGENIWLADNLRSQEGEHGPAQLDARQPPDRTPSPWTGALSNFDRASLARGRGLRRHAAASCRRSLADYRSAAYILPVPPAPPPATDAHAALFGLGLSRIFNDPHAPALARALDPATNRPRVRAVSGVAEPLGDDRCPKRQDRDAVHADRGSCGGAWTRSVSLGARIGNLLRDAVAPRSDGLQRVDSGPTRKILTCSPDEFIRRFLLHVLPKGFHRIRHYGLLASAGRKANVARARELLAAPAPTELKETALPPDPRSPCPCCGGRMVVIEIFQRAAQARAPPSSPTFTGMSVS